MAENFRLYPDESIEDLRFDEDIVYLVVNEKDWEQNIIFGFSTSSYAVARIYAREHKDDNWVITCV